MRRFINPVLRTKRLLERKKKMYDSAKVWGVNKELKNLYSDKDGGVLNIVIHTSSDNFIYNPNFMIEESVIYSKIIEGQEFSFTTKIFCNAKTNKIKFGESLRRRYGGCAFTTDYGFVTLGISGRLERAMQVFAEKIQKANQRGKMLAWLKSFFAEDASIHNEYGGYFTVSNLIGGVSFKICVDENENGGFEIGDWRLLGDGINPLMFKILINSLSFRPEYRVGNGKRRIIMETQKEEKRIAKNEKTFLI